MEPIILRLNLVACVTCNQLRQPYAAGNCRECHEMLAARESRSEVLREIASQKPGGFHVQPIPTRAVPVK